MRKLPSFAILTILFVLANQYLLIAQTKKIDSLRVVLAGCKNDTAKINTLNKLGWELSESKPDTSIFLSNQALELCEKLQTSSDKAIAKAAEKGLVSSLGCLGTYYTNKADYSKSLEYHSKALKIAQSLDNKRQIANQLGNIGGIYLHKGDYPYALEYYLKNLKILEEIGDKKKIGGVLGNLGIVHRLQMDLPKAIQYFFKALKAEEECGNKKGILRSLGNLGNANSSTANLLKDKGDTALANVYASKALEYFSKALVIGEELKAKSLIAITLSNMANIYADRANAAFKNGEIAYANTNLYPKAFDTYFKVLKIAEDLGNKQDLTLVLSHLGCLYEETGKYLLSYDYLYRALAVSNDIGALNEQKYDYEYLSKLYEKSTVLLPDTIGGKILNKEEMRLRALHYYKKFRSLNDSIFSRENKEEILRKEMNYNFDKKEAATKADQDKKDIISKEELKQKEQQRNYFIIGFALLALLVLFIFKGYNDKQKANKIITLQKLLVEEKQKEILDSIHYAKRIQTSLLPTEKYIERILNKKYKTQN